MGEEKPSFGATPLEAKRVVEEALEDPEKRIFVFEGWCKLCGICIDICPRKALEPGPDGIPRMAFLERCTGCGLCELHCPDFAITVLKLKDSVGRDTSASTSALRKIFMEERSLSEVGQDCSKDPRSRVRFMQGNEACVEGALLAGLNFYGGYPITPSSEIAEILSRRLPQEGGVFIQMEDEIASIAACIGASLGGAKAMTATSGPGFSLMQENIGFAAMAEIPVVIVNVQRAGPSTGGPSSVGQGDLMQARWGTHGDHPIIVLSPSSVAETLELTIQAFNLAEEFRTPVILLSDEVIGHLRERIVVPLREDAKVVVRKPPAVPPEQYKPSANTPEIPPLAPFGAGYRYHVTGLLHDESGFPTLRPEEINPWFDRVFRKIEKNLDRILLYEAYGVEDAEVLLISFGISARSALAAMRLVREEGRKVGMVKLLTLWPFPEGPVREFARRVNAILVPELNRGQLVLEVERVAGCLAKVKGIGRVDGEILEPGEILKELRRL